MKISSDLVNRMDNGKIEIPEIDVSSKDFDHNSLVDSREQLNTIFFDRAGCLILRNVFVKEDMDAYNKWCEKHLDSIKDDSNSKHPKQHDKWLINDVLERMSADQPELLLRLLNNDKLNFVLDSLIGFARFGAVTTHWIEPGGCRQKSHVDYPCHVKSGKFWENNPELIHRYFTDYQINHVLPYFSVQTLIASDKMGKYNGSTEVVPGSHLIHNVDSLIHNDDFYQSMEAKFENVELNQGDVLIFNRRLVHRGGNNISDGRRNSLIMQNVFLFGLGQHQTDTETVENNLKEYLNKLDSITAKEFLLRIKAPYPINTRNHT